MRITLIAPVGDRPEAMYPALREFSVQHVHLLTVPKYIDQAKKLRKDLEKFGITTSEGAIGPQLWEGTFVAVQDFARHHPHPEQVMVHVGVGDRDMQCAATSAAFVSGLRAINGNKDIVMVLPIMKFSYYTQLQDRKLKIMETLAQGSQPLSAISRALRISLSLLSYHVHGNQKSEGLIDMGLVELTEKDNQSFLSLTAMGRLLLRGYLPEAEIA